MPILTRWFIKTSLVYLVAALGIAILQAAVAPLRLPAWLDGLSPVYFHLFMLGWVTQLIVGVVYWMFPKYSADRPRGNETLAWATFWLLNAGLLLRVTAEPLNYLAPGTLWGWLLVLSALLQWIAGSSFVANTWRRVKER